MAITRVTRLASSEERATLSADEASDVWYYDVESSDLSTTCLEACQATDGVTTIPATGSAHPDDTRLKAKTVEATRLDEAPSTHRVRVTWSSAASNSPGGGGGGDRWDIELDVDGARVTETVDKDRHGIRIVNTNGEAFPLAVEKEYFDRRYTISFKTFNVDNRAEVAQGCVNKDVVTLSIRGYTRSFAPGTLKWEETKARIAVAAADPSLPTPWQCSYVLLARSKTWTRKIANVGFKAKDAGGKLADIIDDRGGFCSTPRYLANDGTLLPDGANAVLLEFDIEEEENFGPILAGLTRPPGP